MGYHLVTDDAGSSVRAVLVVIVTKVGDSGVRTGHEYLGNSAERVAYFAEELMLTAHDAAMLSSVMGYAYGFLLAAMRRSTLSISRRSRIRVQNAYTYI
jgi:hypothetical protein